MDIRGLSRQFGALALVVGPIAVVLGSLFEVSADDDPVSANLAKIAGHHGDQRALIVMDLLAAFMLPAMLYLMRMARRGAPRTAVVGGSIAFLGWLAGLASLGSSDVLLDHAAALPDRATAVSLVTSVVNDPGFVVPEVIFIIGHLLGMLILGFALWRSRAVPAWIAALVGIGPLVHLAVHNQAGAVDAAAYTLVAIGMAACAITLLRTSNDAWDLPADTTTAGNDAPSVLTPRLPISR